MRQIDGMTEDEVIEILQRVSKSLARKFVFGYHDVEDIAAQGVIFGLEALDKYDGVRPLDRFLWVHIHNRLFNYKRNNYCRNDSPCLKCSKNETCENGCKVYIEWDKRNTRRRNIMSPADIEYTEDDNNLLEDNSDWQSNKEILDIIDRELPVELRREYLLMLSNNYVPLAKKTIIINTILEILSTYRLI